MMEKTKGVTVTGFKEILSCLHRRACLHKERLPERMMARDQVVVSFFEPG